MKSRTTLTSQTELQCLSVNSSAVVGTSIVAPGLTRELVADCENFRTEKWSNLLAAPSKRIRFVVHALHGNICLAMGIRRERKALSVMSASQLRDIGVHRAVAELESKRGFFDIPDNRQGLR